MENCNPNLKNRKKKLPNSLNTATRYSGLAFEMFAIILAGVFGGIKLDEKLNTHPLFTALLSFVAVILAIYFAVKEFLRTPKNEK